MKKMTIILLLFVISLFLFSCGTEIETLSSSILINNPSEINTIEIKIPTKNGTATQINIKDPSDIENLVSLVMNLQVKKLSAREEIKILNQGKKLVEGYFIDFQNKDDYKMETLGLIILLPQDDVLMFQDLKSMNSAQRTISYIPVDNQSEIVKNIDSIVEKYR
ncbi:MAG: hypothetical protein ACYC2T_09005 [Bacillota bacterium]